MWLSLGQLCGSIPQPGGLHRLYTAKYKYPSPDDRWCRHHLQGNVPLPPPLRDGAMPVTLDDLHVPTGFTTVEEVLRFCLTDLGAERLSGEWDRVLTESYERFKTDFAPRGQPA